MRGHLIARLLITPLIFSMNAACGSVISKEMRAKARGDLSITEVMAHPTAYVGQHVIWGGIILENRQGPKGTMLLVLETPLDRFEMPRNEHEARGRFEAKTEYLNPEAYRPNARVTLAGEIIGQGARTPGEKNREYPLVEIQEVYLWPQTVPEYGISVPPPPEIWAPAETWGHGR